jgi:hypothetical protein
MKLFIPVLALSLFIQTYAFASLSQSQRSVVFQGLKIGDYGVLDRLTLDGESLGKANVNVPAFVHMVQVGNNAVLADRGLSYHPNRLPPPPRCGPNTVGAIIEIQPGPRKRSHKRF